MRKGFLSLDRSRRDGFPQVPMPRWHYEDDSQSGLGVAVRSHSRVVYLHTYGVHTVLLLLHRMTQARPPPLPPENVFFFPSPSRAEPSRLR